MHYCDYHEDDDFEEEDDAGDGDWEHVHDDDYMMQQLLEISAESCPNLSELQISGGRKGSLTELAKFKRYDSGP